MSTETKRMNIFERYLTVWVGLCIVGGILLGKLAPGLAQSLDGMSLTVKGAPVVSIPIAVCLFFMMYPIMVKIDFTEVIQAGKSGRPVFMTLFINWAVKPFTMYAIALLFLGFLFKSFIGPEAMDLVKMPFGLDLPVGASHGSGVVVMEDGVKMLQVPLWRSYFAGCILLGIAPCTAMVLVWGYLARGNDGLTLVMVAINSLTMLLLYGVLGGFLLGVGKLPIPWQALLLSVSIYVALPLITGYFSRKMIIDAKGEQWFKEKFLGVLTPVTITALLVTLVLLFSFKGCMYCIESQSEEKGLRLVTIYEIACFISEPIQGVGGAVTPPKEFLGIIYEYAFFATHVQPSQDFFVDSSTWFVYTYRI